MACISCPQIDTFPSASLIDLVSYYVEGIKTGAITSSRRASVFQSNYCQQITYVNCYFLPNQVRGTGILHTVSRKWCHYIFASNFAKCWASFTVISPTDLAVNL